ncbi:MAG TPA: nucleotidyltransferase domain-containing protein, partial [Candidatus Methylomirabilis sp.]|jgi:predicted nucleotidyltransferase
MSELTGGRARVDIPKEKIAEFCRKYHIRRLSLFGSALREDFRPDSDVDVLVSFAEDAHYSLFDLVAMEEELKNILGREVDLVEREAVERSENYIRRRHILEGEEPVYVAG